MDKGFREARNSFYGKCMIDHKSKVFFLVFFLMIVLALSYGYYRFIFSRHYEVLLQVPCDPSTKTCFAVECDPTAAECTGDPKQDTTYFVKVSKMAHDIAQCDPNDSDCQKSLMCQAREDQCTENYCETSELAEGERCSVASDAVSSEDDRVTQVDAVSPEIPDDQSAMPTDGNPIPSEEMVPIDTSASTPVPGSIQKPASESVSTPPQPATLP